MTANSNGKRGRDNWIKAARDLFAQRKKLLSICCLWMLRVEALRLWLMGVRLVPRLDAAAAKGRNTCLASGKTRAYIARALTDRGGRALVQ